MNKNDSGSLSSPIIMGIPEKLLLDARGQWWSGKVKFTNHRVIDYFNRRICWSATHETWLVQVLDKAVPVEVEDTAWQVKSIDINTQPMSLLISDGTKEHFCSESLYSSVNLETLYCLIKDRTHPARLLSAAVQAVQAEITEKDGRYFYKETLIRHLPKAI